MFLQPVDLYELMPLCWICLWFFTLKFFENCTALMNRLFNGRTSPAHLLPNESDRHTEEQGMARSVRVGRRLALLFFFLVVHLGCPSGNHGPNGLLALLGIGGTQPGGTMPPTDPALYSYSGPFVVGGSVTGLAAGTNTVTVQLNGSEQIVLSRNATFQFATPLVKGAVYSVAVTSATGSSWTSANCTASNNSGALIGSNALDVKIICSSTLYPLQVNVSGLTGGNTVVFQNNGAMDLSVASNGTTAFATSMPVGSGFHVKVKTQPTGGANQTCTPTGNIGFVSTNPTVVNVICSTASYTIGGSSSAGNGVPGLAGSGLKVRLNNTGEELIFAGTSASDLAFKQPVADGTAYQVVITQQPVNRGQTCTILRGNGIVSSANVTNVKITCETHFYSEGGSVTGLSGSESIVVLYNGGSNRTVSASNPYFSFYVPGSGWTQNAVSILPGSDTAIGKSCTVLHGSSVYINCTSTGYRVNVAVAGLCPFQNVYIRNNATNMTNANAGNGFAFSFPPQNNLSGYNVTVFSQPSNVSCTVTSGNATGTISGANVNVVVTCTGCMSCNGTKTFKAVWPPSRSTEAASISGGGTKLYFDVSPNSVSTSSPGILDIPNTTSTNGAIVTGRTSGCTYNTKILHYSALKPASNLSGNQSVAVP